MARATVSGGRGGRKYSPSLNSKLKRFAGAVPGIVGASIIEGIGGPKAKVAGRVVKTSAKVARAMAKEAAGPRAKAPFGTYRKPSPNRRPRLRDTDNTPRKTTVRQKSGPKTKSGKFTEPKRKSRTNTQPPARTKVEKPKAEIPAVTKVGGRVVSINKRATTLGARKRQEAQLRLGREEFKTERQRQTRLALRRGAKADLEQGSIRPSQPTIESRLRSGSESIPLTSRNQAGTDRMPIAELKRYAQLLRESTAKKPNVSPAQIAGGRARATMPTAERRAAAIKEAQERAVTKAKERGMTDAQIKNMIAKAKAEAAAIAKKAK